MSDARKFPEEIGKSSEQVDAFLDDLATGQNDMDRPQLDPTDEATVSDWESEVGVNQDQTTSSIDQTKSNAADVAETAKEKTSELTGQAQDKGQEVASKAKEKASELSGQAQAKADEGMTKAADGVSQAADALRQRGETSSGAMGSAATTAAEKLDDASAYLREKDTDQLLQDIEALIRRKPVESLLVAAGAGFVLSKLLG